MAKDDQETLIPAHSKSHSPSETGSDILERRRRSGVEDVSAKGSGEIPPSNSWNDEDDMKTGSEARE